MLSIFTKEKTSESKNIEKGTENKKIIENLVLILVLFIIVIVVMNVLNEDSPTEIDSTSSINTLNTVIKNESEKTLDEKLEDILSFIDGAGRVEVLITYQNGIEQVPMYNLKQNIVITQENDKAGGTRKTEEKIEEQNIIFKEDGNMKSPVIRQNINPEIIGVIVVAEGAGNINVKEKLMKAVEAALNISTHRIQVLTRKT